jgi:hypothetical protein
MGATNDPTFATTIFQASGGTEQARFTLNEDTITLDGNYDDNGFGTVRMTLNSSDPTGNISLHETNGIDIDTVDTGITIDADTDSDSSGSLLLDAGDAGLAINETTGIRLDATTAGVVTLNGVDLDFDTGTNETRLSPATASADRTITVPNEQGTMEVLQSGQSTLTDNTATNILSFPLANGEFIAGTIVTVAKCDDTTNIVWRHDTSDFICLNNADTESCSFTSNLGTALELNDGAGNFTAGYALGVSTAGTNTVTITLDADCSLTPTTLVADWEIEFHQPEWELVTELN